MKSCLMDEEKTTTRTEIPVVGIDLLLYPDLVSLTSVTGLPILTNNACIRTVLHLFHKVNAIDAKPFEYRIAAIAFRS